MYSWNVILPLLVSASKSGNSSPRFTILCQKVDLLRHLFFRASGSEEVLDHSRKSECFWDFEDLIGQEESCCICTIAGEKTGNENVISTSAVTELTCLGIFDCVLTR